MTNMAGVLRSNEKKDVASITEGTLFDRNIDIIYKGDIQLIEESLSNLLSINSLEKLRRLYHTNIHNNDFKINIFNKIADQISSCEVDHEELEDEIMFHMFALKVSNYFLSKLVSTQKYQLSKSNIKNEKTFLEDVSIQFQKQILRISFRTLVLDLNINRENGSLQGETKEEKYSYYNKSMLSTPVYLKQFFSTYPSLLRIIANEVRKYRKTLNELLARYDQDKVEISHKFFNQKEIEKISTIQMGMGDAHSDGRRVTQLILEKNELFYKPRSLYIDCLYQDIAGWLNEKVNNSYEITTPKVISKNNYGWVEYISFKECTSEKGIKKFYKRMGGQIALLYTLNAVDFHSENIIASGSHPILVDLESLFHIPYENSKDENDNAFLKVEKKLNSSVRSIGLLPFFFGSKNKVDVSGIGRKGEVQSLIKIPQIKNRNTADMRIEREYMNMESSLNHPKWNGEYVYAQDYIREIKDGFIQIFEIISEHSIELVEILDNFKEEIFVRFIPKPTVLYASLLELSLHPRFLHNSIDREVFLAKIWEETKSNDNFVQLAKYEYRDLINDDVPYFKLSIDSTDLLTSRNKVIPDYFNHSPIELVRKKIMGLGKEDLEFQLKVIDLSMLATIDDRENELKKFVQKNEDNYKQPFDSKQYFINKAEEIADYSFAQAYVGSKDGKTNYSWLNATPMGVEEIQWNLVPMGDTLYDGLSGMSLTYLSLWLVTKKEKYLDIALEIVEDISSRMRVMELSEETTDVSIGGYTGISSIIYTLMNFYVFTKEKKYKELSLNLTDKISVLLQKDKEFDIIGGAAGAIAVLISCYEHEKDETFLNSAIQCGNHLINNATEINQGEVSWVGIAQQPLTGFSHGNAGIIYALSLLNNYVKDEEITEIILKGMEYENKQMVESNWVDRRKPVKEAATSAWCHGSPGILLSRLGLSDSYNQKLAHKATADMEVAWKNIFYDGFGREHSLCHGDVGNAMILIAHGRKTNDPGRIEIAQNLMFESLLTSEKTGYKCGVGKQVETPNLMVGLAGIIYGALFACDKRIPDILSLKLGKFE